MQAWAGRCGPIVLETPHCQKVLYLLNGYTLIGIGILMTVCGSTAARSSASADFQRLSGGSGSDVALPGDPCACCSVALGLYPRTASETWTGSLAILGSLQCTREECWQGAETYRADVLTATPPGTTELEGRLPKACPEYSHPLWCTPPRVGSLGQTGLAENRCAGGRSPPVACTPLF